MCACLFKIACVLVWSMCVVCVCICVVCVCVWVRVCVFV